MSASAANRRRGIHFLAGALLFAFIVRLCIGMLYTNYFDVTWYRTWALALPDGFFDCYTRLMEGRYALDYPPVYLVVLYFVGWLYRLFPLQDYAMLDMLAMKFFPILFDILAAMMLYLCCRRRGENIALLAACFWALNPSAVFNAACWGQTDGMMLFFLLLSFYTVENGRPVLGSVLFAVAGLAKMQTLYFTPVLFLYLLRRYKWEKTVLGVGAAMATGYGAFVPFILGSWPARGAMSLVLPFEVYFGGLGKYPYAALNTYNLYGLFNLNWVSDSKSLFFGHPDPETGMMVGGFTLNMLSLLFILGALALLAVVMLRGREDGSLWAGSFLFMQCIFMLTTRQHERYQIVVLPFALLLFVWSRQMRHMWLFIALSLTTFVNQFMLLIRNNTINDPAAPWNAIFEPAQVIFSAVNLLLFAWGAAEVWFYAFRKDTPPAEPEENVPPAKEATT